MKLNKQKIDEIKNKIINIKGKITTNQEQKVPKRYYALLVLMIMLGIVTLSNNMKKYNKSNKEEYIEYEIKNQEVSQSDIEIGDYITDQSSISTTVSNIEVEAVETMSTNSKLKYIMPVKGEILKEFAVEKLVYSETLGMWKTHPGIDIKAEIGTEVKSVCDGTVKIVLQDSFYGNTIKVVSHEGYVFVYSNLDGNIKLKEGETVSKGDKIGEIGVSAKGELSDEAHLHFEVIKDETQVNPLDFIN